MPRDPARSVVTRAGAGKARVIPATRKQPTSNPCTRFRRGGARGALGCERLDRRAARDQHPAATGRRVLPHYPRTRRRVPSTPICCASRLDRARFTSSATVMEARPSFCSTASARRASCGATSPRRSRSPTAPPSPSTCSATASPIAPSTRTSASRRRPSSSIARSPRSASPRPPSSGSTSAAPWRSASRPAARSEWNGCCS